MNITEILGRRNRQTIPSKPNPLDKATIVSILPTEIYERKATIQPGVFIIPPGTYEKPALLTVGPSSWWREIDENQPLLEIPESAVRVAESVIKDWASGLLACNMHDKMPGLFYVLGQVGEETIKTEYKSELIKAKLNQDRWFRELVGMGDSLWARSNGNPLAIDNWMKLAATSLGLQKDWTNEAAFMEMERCFACGHLKNPKFPICGNCRTIDPKHPQAKNITKAS